MKMSYYNLDKFLPEEPSLRCSGCIALPPYSSASKIDARKKEENILAEKEQ